MNKKILISLSVIGIISAIVIGGTIAYFNDTETSTGNIFTAGSIDLKVDHVKQTYNDIDCKTCSVEIYSNNGGDMVIEKNGVAVVPHYPAVLAWTHNNWMTALSFDPDDKAKWIWEQNPTQQADTQVDTSYTFQNTFEWMGPITDATLDLALGSDNMYTVYLNNNQIGEDLSENNFSSPDHITSIPENYFNQGANTLKFVVTNKGVIGSNSSSNPAGLIYKFTINGNCGDDYFKTHCTLFGEKDLGTGDYFWRFDDVKPGDEGTNVISLHITSNDAYVCLINNGVDDQENVLTETEADAGDTTDPLGELSDYLELFIWNDIDGDGVYEPTAEVDLYEGGFLTTEMTPLSLSVIDIDYLGVAWCMGVQTVNHTNGDISCSGIGDQDKAQTDILLADIVLYAVQQRNNEGFDCDSVILRK